MKEDVPIRVLVADDRRMIRGLLTSLLTDGGEFLPVAHARTAQQVLAAAVSAGPDLIICAPQLGGRSGIEICRQVRDRRPDVRTVILSRGADGALLEQCVLAGVSGIVSRGATVAEFYDTLHRVMAGETVVPPSQVPMLLERLSARRQESDALMRRFLHLTRREREVLQLVVDGHRYRGVASELYISPQTARRHIHNLLTKLEVATCVEAASRCVAAGLVSASPVTCDEAV